MKTLTSFLLFLFVILECCFAQVKIGSNPQQIQAGVLLELESSSGGLLPPRLSTAERDAITNAPEGLLIYNTTLKCLQFNKGTAANPNWICTDGTNESNPFTCGVSTITFVYNMAPVTYGTVVGHLGKCWLDRNLGASQVANTQLDFLAYGDLFQWGRLADGHQSVLFTSSTLGSYINGATTILSSQDVPGHPQFIIAPTSPRDWRSAPNNNLWQGTNGINNPCPVGFRLPTEAEFTLEVNAWQSQNLAGGFASALKLTPGGRADLFSGNLFNIGVNGYYWLQDTDGGFSKILIIQTTGYQIPSTNRALAGNVRCIKD